jgi:hypothetical protein
LNRDIRLSRLLERGNMRRIFAIATLVALAGCTDEKGATKALHDAGLKPVSVGGYAWFYCAVGRGSADAFATKFTAKNARGEAVRGAVCEGYANGTRIRYHNLFEANAD